MRVWLPAKGSRQYEHYAQCRTVADLALRSLGLTREDSSATRLASFLLLYDRGLRGQREGAIAAALRAAAAYRIHGLARHGRVRTGVAAQEAWRQSLRELARGSRAAAALLDKYSS